ncbi:hypothetical protein ACUR5C_08400 [Aliikangiella sp. IMCC44653]
MINKRLVLFKLIYIWTLLFSLPAVADLLIKKQQLSEYKEYKKPTREQTLLLEDQFFEFFNGNDLALKEFYRLKPLGNSASRQPHSSLLGISIKELGWGQFVFNRELDERFLLQVPHRFNDKYTLNIAYHLWKNGLVGFIYTNLVHRYNNEKMGRQHTSDFSHSSDSPLVAATKAWLAYNNKGIVVQLHGFSKNKRKTKQAKMLNIILSHGVNHSKYSFSKLSSAKVCLEESLGVAVGVYPVDTIELGGTKNIVGQEVRKIVGFENFIHIEIDKRTRLRLKNSSSDSIAMFRCIKNAYQ